MKRPTPLCRLSLVVTQFQSISSARSTITIDTMFKKSQQKKSSCSAKQYEVNFDRGENGSDTLPGDMYSCSSTLNSKHKKYRSKKSNPPKRVLSHIHCTDKRSFKVQRVVHNSDLGLVSPVQQTHTYEENTTNKHISSSNTMTVDTAVVDDFLKAICDGNPLPPSQIFGHPVMSHSAAIEKWLEGCKHLRQLQQTNHRNHW